MARGRNTVYACSSCGHELSKWLGRCPSCKEWNSFREFHHSSEQSADAVQSPSMPARLSDVEVEPAERFETGISELDRVLGGGLSPGTAVLLGGEPGIGKSTLMLQLAARVGTEQAGSLYVSGEESTSQLKRRAERLGINQNNIDVLCETSLPTLMGRLEAGKYSLVIIDSIQTMLSDVSGGMPGTVNQIKMVGYQLASWSKSSTVPIFLIAHVTREGTISGPKVIEHLVDTVLYFEQTSSELRVLRATKNRLGSVDEVGLFNMTARGLNAITDTMGLFLERRDAAMPPGTAVAAVYEGSRVLLVEVQALTVSARAGLGRVYSDKIDSARVSRVAAVLERHAGIRFSDQDIYVNVAGGLKIRDTAVELALALALFSARTERALSANMVSVGELSLAGEIRVVHQLRRRVKTAMDSGFDSWLSAALKDESGSLPGRGRECARVSDAIAAVVEK